MNTYYHAPAPGPTRQTVAPVVDLQQRIATALYQRDWCVLVSLAAQDATDPQLITDAAIQAGADLDATLDDLKAWAETCSDQGYWVKTSAAWGTLLSGLAAAIGRRSLTRLTGSSTHLRPTSSFGGMA